MNIETQEVTIRHLTPSGGMAIHRIGTDEYYPEGLYLAKGESEANFEEVPIEDVPHPEPPETVETNEVEAE